MQKELNLHGDKYTAYSPDNINWVCIAEENVIPDYDIIEDNELNEIITNIARDGIVECIKALKLPIAKPNIKYNSCGKDFYRINHAIYNCNYFDNDYYVRTKIDKTKRRLAYYFYKNKDDVAKLLKFNTIKWLCECEDFYE